MTQGHIAVALSAKFYAVMYEAQRALILCNIGHLEQTGQAELDCKYRAERRIGDFYESGFSGPPDSTANRNHFAPNALGLVDCKKLFSKS